MQCVEMAEDERLVGLSSCIGYPGHPKQTFHAGGGFPWPGGAGLRQGGGGAAGAFPGRGTAQPVLRVLPGTASTWERPFSRCCGGPNREYTATFGLAAAGTD